MSKHIVSTLSASTDYTDWDNAHGVRTKRRSVTVKGGALVASAQRGGDPYTPQGLITHVSDDDAKFLSEHPHFKEHQERGFVKIITINKDADTVAQSMTKDDLSRPKTEKDVADYQKANEKKNPDMTGLQAVTNKGK